MALLLEELLEDGQNILRLSVMKNDVSHRIFKNFLPKIFYSS